MNLIEQLGGYEAAKGLFNLYEYSISFKYYKVFKGDFESAGYIDVFIPDLQKALLEYRRQHNIFVVGDKVVFRECSGIGGASDAIDLMTVKSIDAFGVRMTNSLCPWAIQIRHATDAEIKAGKRLEVS